MPNYKVKIVRSEYRECSIEIDASSKEIAEAQASEMEQTGKLEKYMKLTDQGVLIEAHPDWGGKRARTNGEKMI